MVKVTRDTHQESRIESRIRGSMTSRISGSMTSRIRGSMATLAMVN